MFFVHFYSFAVQETITTPLVLNLYEFEQYQVNLLFIGVGVLSLFTSAAVGFLSRFFSDRAMLVLSLVLGLVGSLLLVDSNKGEPSEEQRGAKRRAENTEAFYTSEEQGDED